MSTLRTRRPSPALVVGLVALFFALGGTASAVVTAAVPLAKRALVADKAKIATKAKSADSAKNAAALNGLTATQIASAGAQAAVSASPPGARPASTAAGLVTLKKTQVSFTPEEQQGFTIPCDAGQRALGGGYSSNQSIIGLDSFPTNNPPNGWSLYLINATDPPVAASADIYVTCLG